MANTIQDALSTAIVTGGFSAQETRQPVAGTGTPEVASPAQKQEAQEQQEHQFVEPGSMDETATKNMTEELNKAMERANSNLEFKYHKEVNMMSVAVVDKTSGKVIKELPPEEMVNNMIKSKIWIGAFLDKIA